MNLNNLNCNPQGILTIKIKGAIDMPFDKIDEKLGWDNNLLDTSIGIENLNLNNLEKALLILINKLRTNTVLFAQQYLENIRYLTTTTNKLYNLLIKMSLKLVPFKITLQLTKLLKDLKPNMNPDLYLIENYEKKVGGIKLNIKKHQDMKPLSIIIKILLDDKIRNNLLNPNHTHLGLCINECDSSISKYNSTIIIFNKPKIQQIEIEEYEIHDEY